MSKNKKSENFAKKLTSKLAALHVEWLILMLTLLTCFWTIDAKIDRQSSRTDRLYEMFIELVKQTKN